MTTMPAVKLHTIPALPKYKITQGIFDHWHRGMPTTLSNIRDFNRRFRNHKEHPVILWELTEAIGNTLQTGKTPEGVIVYPTTYIGRYRLPSNPFTIVCEKLNGLNWLIKLETE